MPSVKTLRVRTKYHIKKYCPPDEQQALNKIQIHFDRSHGAASKARCNFSKVLFTSPARAGHVLREATEKIMRVPPG